MKFLSVVILFLTHILVHVEGSCETFSARCATSIGDAIYAPSGDAKKLYNPIALDDGQSYYANLQVTLIEHRSSTFSSEFSFHSLVPTRSQDCVSRCYSYVRPCGDVCVQRQRTIANILRLHQPGLHFLKSSPLGIFRIYFINFISFIMHCNCVGFHRLHERQCSHQSNRWQSALCWSPICNKQPNSLCNPVGVSTAASLKS